MTKILGLDISTSTIGIAVLDFKKNKTEIIYIDYYKPIKKQFDDDNEDFLNTLYLAKKHILEIIEIHKPDYVAVEDFIRFLKGGSGAATIIPLSILNRTICLGIKENYQTIPLYVCNVVSIRTKIKKDCGRKELPPKEEVPKILEDLLNIEIPRPEKKTRKGIKIAEEHWDMADAVAVAYYCKRLKDGHKTSI